MARVFQSGDKVFAKVRGYPAWPARVEGVADSSSNSLRYHVLFYGTLQRGVCKSKEIFPYAEHKEKYAKSVKRKGYKEALDQIEGVLPIPELVPKVVIKKLSNGNEATESVNNEMNNCDRTGSRKKVVKRKLDSFIANVSDSNAYSVTVDSSSSRSSKDGDNDSDEIYTSKPPEKCQEDKTSDVMYLPPVTRKPANKKRPPSKSLKKRQMQAASPDQLVPSSDPMTQTPNCPQDAEDIAIVTSDCLPAATVSRSGRVIKRKTFGDEGDEPTPKAKRGRRPAREHLQEPLPQQPPPRDEDEEEDEVQMQRRDSEDSQASRERIEKRQTARKWLATENCMTRLDTLVRAQLGMNKANPEQCIRFLDDMCDLDLQPLMLKKHPEVVQTIKRLRKYVGNASAWNFSDEQIREFEEQAHQIRLRAEYLFDKFKFMFSAPDNSTFLKVFADSVIAFQSQTRHWPLAKIYALVAEPKARRPSKTQKMPSKNKDS